MIRWEEPTLILLTGVSKTKGLCNPGSGDSGDCNAGNGATGFKCWTGTNATNDCGLGISADVSCISGDLPG